jgi:hypothetical protein
MMGQRKEKLVAIGFYDTKVSAPIDDEIFMIQVLFF